MAEAPPQLDPARENPPRDEETQGSSVSADEIGDASFPASDPPAAWTWEVKSGQEELGGKTKPPEP